MGNIADALKKAGVDLGAKDSEIQEPKEDANQTKVEPLPEESAEPSDEALKTDTAETLTTPATESGEEALSPAVERSYPVGTGGYADSWDERIRLVIDKNSPFAESFRVLRSKILHPDEGKPRARTILIASNAPQEGKSFIAANLAVAFARGLDQYALLVDCDLRRPNVANLLGIQGKVEKGLTEYLQGEVEISDILLKTSVEKLSVLPSGYPPANPAELLSSDRMARLIDELSDRYPDRFIIFDSAPFLVASESNVLTRKVDGVVIVVRYGKSDRRRIRAMIDSIGEDKVLGVVFNGQEENYIKKKVLDRYSQYGDYYSSKRK